MKLCRVGDVGPKDFKNASPSVYGLCVWTKVACILMALIATCMLIVYIVGVIPGIFKKFKFITPFRLYFSGFLMSAFHWGLLFLGWVVFVGRMGGALKKDANRINSGNGDPCALAPCSFSGKNDAGSWGPSGGWVLCLLMWIFTAPYVYWCFMKYGSRESSKPEQQQGGRQPTPAPGPAYAAPETHKPMPQTIDSTEL
eukprot:TRINITY_DN3147_c0_g1_i4.p1 TRINITY_DN3147_c0_g1~~TRINITY_DN3147_c0_g1_i4.p1  ORF type:complete len:198 (-),score=33.84 TRINITY_DN3147_c0_g1_i4:209-802(-)